MIDLPKEKIVAVAHSPKKTVLYGMPKVGKTTLLAKLDDCLIIDLEDGSDYVDALKVKANSLDELGEVGAAIVKQNYPYKRIAIDTVTKLEEWCEEEATIKYMNSSVGASFNRDKLKQMLPKKDWKSVLTLPHGAGYLWLRISYKSWIDRLAMLAPEIIFIGHLKDKIINKAGKEVSASDLDLTGKIRNITCQKADAIGYVYRKDDKTMMSFETKDEITCGSRCAHLKGQEFVIGELADENKMDSFVAFWDKVYLD